MTYDQLASSEAVARTVEGLKGRNIEGIVVADRAEALEKIKELVPAGASVMNGSSRTLEEIGFIEYLKTGTHGWQNLHAEILAEQDPAKQARLRRESVLSDYYLGSVHALAEDGQIVIASNTGSQLPHLVYTSPNLILVVSTKKIVPTLDEALRRLDEYVVPLEDARMMEAYQSHTKESKLLVIKHEPEFMQRKVRVILVNEALGF